MVPWNSSTFWKREVYIIVNNHIHEERYFHLHGSQMWWRSSGNTIRTTLVSILKRSQHQRLMDGSPVSLPSGVGMGGGPWTIRPIWERTQDRLIDRIRDIPALPTPHKWTIWIRNRGLIFLQISLFIGLYYQYYMFFTAGRQECYKTQKKWIVHCIVL